MQKLRPTRIFAVLVFALVPTTLSYRAESRTTPSASTSSSQTLTTLTHSCGFPLPALTLTRVRGTDQATGEEWEVDRALWNPGFRVLRLFAAVDLVVCGLLVVLASLLPRWIASRIAGSVLLGSACGLLLNLLHNLRIPAQGKAPLLVLPFLLVVPPSIILLLSLRARRPLLAVALHSAICACLLYASALWADQLMARQIMGAPSREDIWVVSTAAVVFIVLSLLVWPAFRALGWTNRWRHPDTAERLESPDAARGDEERL